MASADKNCGFRIIVAGHSAEFDPLRRKAEPKVEMGAGFPERFVSILRMSYAGVPRQEKSLVMASSHKSLKFEDASANMRRLSGSRGGKGRKDVLLAEAADGPLGSDEDLEAWTAYRMAQKKGASKSKKDGAPKRGGGRV